MSKTAEETEDTMAHIARSTGAFNTSQKAPPLGPEPKTGVRKKPGPSEQDTRPDHKPVDPRPSQVPSLPVSPEAIEALVEAVGGKLSVENVRALIVRECRDLEGLLLEKNAAYGNSALDPIRLFSKASPIEQLLVRIDDKLSRISRGDFAMVKEEDLKVVTKDLLGYLILIRVAWRLGLK
jgi:hypothetical protein